MNVTDCLQRARECVELADSMGQPEKKRLLEIADAWLKLADAVSLEATRSTRSEDTPPLAHNGKQSPAKDGI